MSLTPYPTMREFRDAPDLAAAIDLVNRQIAAEREAVGDPAILAEWAASAYRASDIYHRLVARKLADERRRLEAECVAALRNAGLPAFADALESRDYGSLRF